MKNLKFFPFERNRYFYGKLLSVDDFQTEQRYMNDKRRVLNRILHGTGVVCGMQVVEVDDLTISLETGLALDFAGREIVVSKPLTKRLSAIEGFDKYSTLEEDHQDLYLCIVYDEQEEEMVHNITGVSGQQEEYNKYIEGYRLFVTEQEPEQEGDQITALYEHTSTIFQGNGIRIRQRVPKYIRHDTEAEIVITVEKTDQLNPVAFSYQMRMSCVEQAGNDVMTISFDEKNFTSSSIYSFKQKVKAKPVKNSRGYFELVPDSFNLTIGQDTIKEFVQGRYLVDITDIGIPETIMRNYYDMAMEDFFRDPYGQAIYLARLQVIRAGNTYVISRIENLPYKQYVWSNMLSGVLETLRLRQQSLPAAIGRPQIVNIQQNTVPPAREMIGQGRQVNTGSTIIDLGIGGISGQRFYSEEIIHGLGLGEVFITLGLAKGVQDGNQVIYGDQGIFEEKICPRIEMAAKVNMNRGSFVIGIKCLEQVEAKRLRIYWMAAKDGAMQLQDDSMVTLSVRPDIINLQLREGHYFEAVKENEVCGHIRWSVKDAEGGTIDENGYYTAPNQPGVYEIVAQDMEDDHLRATAYVIVREEPLQ